MTDADKRAELARIIEAELADAVGRGGDSVAAARLAAKALFETQKRGDEVEGRSQAHSADVRDMVTATLAMITPMLSTDAGVQFEPDGAEDEQAASAENQVCDRVIMEENAGFIEIQEAVQDALIYRNGCIGVAIETETVTRPVDLPEDAETAELLVGMWRSNGATYRDGQLTETVSRLAVRAVPIETVAHDRAASDVQSARFFSVQLDLSRSDLIKRGIPRAEVEGLTANWTDRVQSLRLDDDFGARADRDGQIIICEDAYVHADLDGDGIEERYRALYASGQVLDYEPVDLVPYAMGAPLLRAHRLTGYSLADHLAEVQAQKTSLLRQLIDNVAIINNGRYAYDPSMVSEEDLMKAIAGGGIRCENVDAIKPLFVADVSSGILAGLSYADKRRSEGGGASLDLLSADAQLVGQTAHGIERQYGSREALASMMARNLAETLIRQTYELTHEYLRRWAPRSYTAEIAGQVVAVDPTQWPARERVNVRVGLSPGERAHLQSVLSGHVQMQSQAMAAGLGGVLANEVTLYRTTIDLLRAAGIDNPERLLIDPESEAAQQAQQQQQEAQQAAQQAAQQLEQQKLDLERARDAGKLRLGFYEAELKVALEEAKLAGQAELEMQQARMNANERAASARA
ncbi:MAG: portal protein [Mangrovicoccus sp.]